LGHDPEGKVLGILGMGGIGRNLKKKAEAFSMKIIYHNRKKLSSELAAGAEYVSFDELLSTSDVISLNLPLNVRKNFLAYSSCPRSIPLHGSPARLGPLLLTRCRLIRDIKSPPASSRR
jgi:hypothetical protein